MVTVGATVQETTAAAAANVTSAAAVLKDSGEGRLIGCGMEAKLFFAATQTLGERRARSRELARAQRE
jgi:hypothetical protein